LKNVYWTFENVEINLPSTGIDKMPWEEKGEGKNKNISFFLGTSPLWLFLGKYT